MSRIIDDVKVVRSRSPLGHSADRVARSVIRLWPCLQLFGKLAHDSRYAVRLWLRRPLQIDSRPVALAIGIGANTGVFSVVNALLLRFTVSGSRTSGCAAPVFSSARERTGFHRWRAQSALTWADTALSEQADVNLQVPGEWRRAHVAQASWNLFFSLLGVQPMIGRAFAAGEDVTGRDGVAVIGYGLWQQLYAGDPKALGSVLHVNGKPLTIIGVAPAGFDYPGKAVLWKPAAFRQGNNGWDAIGRLKPDVSWAQARSGFRRGSGSPLARANSHLQWRAASGDGEPAGRTRGSGQGRVTRADGVGRFDFADRVRQRREPLDGPRRRCVSIKMRHTA